MTEEKIYFDITKHYLDKGLRLEEMFEIQKISQNYSEFSRFAERRVLGEPLAYILGKTTFYGREFKIDKRVYVPNKETEKLVGAVLQEINRPWVRLLEVGTGCGSIAITVKKERPLTQVYAVDIASDALELAKENDKFNSAGVNKFIESRYVENVDQNFYPEIIVADLPYGDESVILHEGGIRELSFMPPLSLFHPKGRLAAQEELIESIRAKKWNPKVFIETGRIPSDEVDDFFKKIKPKKAEYIPMEDYSIAWMQI